MCSPEPHVPRNSFEKTESARPKRPGRLCIGSRCVAPPGKKQFTSKKLLEISGAGTRTSAENAGQTALLHEGDAKSDAFDRGSWSELRDAIAVCCDLPEEVRQSLIDMGDAAA